MLYLVATPIGNLGYITRRAVETFASADLVSSEDTRKTGHLLKHLGISKPQISFHEYNESQTGRRILPLLKEGKSVAVVTNAGTPGISDPGYSLVRLAIDEGIEVTMIPGAAACIMALVLSGLPAHSFCFRGFTPHKQGARRRFFEADAALPYTLVYYESPHRLIKSLNDALGVFGDRQAAVANDLTKMFEQVLRGTLSEIMEALGEKKLRGEFVLCIAGADDPPRREATG